MDIGQIRKELEVITEDAKTAVLATVDTKGKPFMRWVSPAFLKDVPGSIYVITSPKSEKIVHTLKNPHVQWLFQTRNLSKIISIDGIASVHEHVGLISDILESVGKRLQTFWNVNADKHAMVVMETKITHATIFDAVKATQIKSDFSKG